MNTDDVLDIFREAGALLEGHFILSSGLRSPVFLQKAFIFKNPALTEKLCKALAAKVTSELGDRQKVLMVEDIVTTGLSSRECIKSIEETGAKVIGGACIFDRSNGKADIGVPLISLAAKAFPAYEADKLPPELAALPAIKPGSRGLAK